jgi:hypothetical protein
MILFSTAYFPPVQYFSKIADADELIIEAHENYLKQSYRNRCYIYGANGKLSLSIPIKKGPGLKTLIRDVEIEYIMPWQKVHWKSIESAYQSSPYFEFYVDDLLPFFHKKTKYLFDLNLSIIKFLVDALELDADVIFVKNIDNIVPDRLKKFTTPYKKALAGILMSLQQTIFKYLNLLDKPDDLEDKKLDTMLRFIEKDLCVVFDEKIKTYSAKRKIQFIKKKLNRPIRVCGMVANEGEPGGGPFLAINPDGTQSLQIVESSQFDPNNETQKEIIGKATHFNPVDLVCGTKNYKGKKFDLHKFIDKNTGFISQKSQNGKDLKALELPGLWNGAMSDWNTIFVEVPIETFNPVKTINDLLREEHRTYEP